MGHVDDPSYKVYHLVLHVMVERKSVHESSSGVADRLQDALNQNDTDPGKFARCHEGPVPSRAVSTCLKFQGSLHGCVYSYLTGFSGNQCTQTKVSPRVFLGLDHVVMRRTALIHVESIPRTPRCTLSGANQMCLGRCREIGLQRLNLPRKFAKIILWCEPFGPRPPSRHTSANNRLCACAYTSKRY